MAKNVHQQLPRSGAWNPHRWLTEKGSGVQTNPNIDWKTPVVVHDAGSAQNNSASNANADQGAAKK